MQGDKFTRVYAVLLNEDELEEIRSRLTTDLTVAVDRNHPAHSSLRKIDEALERVTKPQVRQER